MSDSIITTSNNIITSCIKFNGQNTTTKNFQFIPKPEDNLEAYTFVKSPEPEEKCFFFTIEPIFCRATASLPQSVKIKQVGAWHESDTTLLDLNAIIPTPECFILGAYQPIYNFVDAKPKTTKQKRQSKSKFSALDKSIAPKFYEREEWLLTQRERYPLEFVVYAKTGINWEILAHSTSEKELYQKLDEILAIRNPAKPIELYFDKF